MATLVRVDGSSKVPTNLLQYLNAPLLIVVTPSGITNVAPLLSKDELVITWLPIVVTWYVLPFSLTVDGMITLLVTLPM